MDVVIDANIMFAALIKKNDTSKLMFSDKLKLHAPDFIFDEFSKYKDVLLEKTHRLEDEFFHLVSIFKQRINVVPKNEYQEYLEKGREIAPDPKDDAYFALALKLNVPIWTHDKRSKEKQAIIEIITTKDLLLMNL